MESLLGSPPSPASPDMIQTNVIRTPDVPSEERSEETRSEEDHVREVLDFSTEARPSCNPQSEDSSQPSGDDGGRSPNLFDSAESFTLYRGELCEVLLQAQDCFVGLDATEFIEFKPDQLSQMHKLNIDKEYTC